MQATDQQSQATIARCFEWAGTFFGVSGAALIAARTDISAYGWLAFAASSILLTFFAYRIRAWGLLLLQLCFCCTNGLGLWRWLIEPALASGALRLPWIG